ncbi:MAG: class I SAM-dependent RNA methyltransferase [Rhodobacteraceae bacterium]|nr:class I SAM-dependent RNA methyltransferase [Paracoccaceae bacterium]MBL4873491.1 class I SAM-dependent RNA methyltransferase [Paracoccaceae bacterium]
MPYKIKHLSIQGDGITDGPNGPIYIPFALTGELVEGEIDGNRIPKPRIVEPSSDRVKAPCPHFKTCGGCSMQHASDTFLADWKTNVVRNALAAHDLKSEFRPIITSPAQSRRRATFAAQRTKKGVLIGFHGRASDTVVDIPSCKLLHPDLMATMPALEALTKIGASRKAGISISVTQSAAGSDVSVLDAKEAGGPMMVELGALVEQFKLSRLSWNGEVVAMRAAPVQTFDGITVSPPVSAFLQATQSGQIAITKTVLEAVGDAKRIVDLFAGCGTFSLPLAKQAQVLAVEGEAPLLDSLDAAWRNADGLKTLETHKRDLFRNPMLKEDLKKIDAVVLDPPRAGAKAQCEALAEANLARIVFVSCNPVTFARDAKILVNAGYTIDWVQVIDQFRWSAHVELVALFTKN